MRSSRTIAGVSLLLSIFSRDEAYIEGRETPPYPLVWAARVLDVSCPLLLGPVGIWLSCCWFGIVDRLMEELSCSI